MPRSLSTAVLAELAKTTGDVHPRTLYTLHLDTGALRYTNHHVDLTFAGNTYAARACAHDAVKTYLENKTDNTTIRLDNVDRHFSAYFASDDFEGRKAEIREIFLQRAAATQNGTVAKTDASIAYDGLSGAFPPAGAATINGEAFTFTGNTGSALTGCSARMNAYLDGATILCEYPIDGNPDTDDSRLLFKGFMDVPDITEQWAEFKLVNLFDRSQSEFPWRKFSDRCNWRFCGAECAYNAGVQPRGTATAGSVTTLTAAELIGASFMIGATVRILDGAGFGAESRITAHNVSTGMIVFDEIDVACDSTSEFLIECDKAESTCEGFGNEENFGGYDFPANNVFLGEDVSVYATGLPLLTTEETCLPLVYGTGMLPGVLLKWDAVFIDNWNQILRRDIAVGVCAGEIDAITDIFFNNINIGADKPGYIVKKTGAAGQSFTYTDINIVPPGYSGQYGLPNLYYPGTAYFVLVDHDVAPGFDASYYLSNAYTGLFERWEPGACTVAVRGQKVRNYHSDGSLAFGGQTFWSDNPVWCLLDFITQRCFQPLNIADVDVVSFYEAALTCQVNGWRLNLTITEAMKETEVVGLILATCRGYLTYTAGQMKLNIETALAGGAAHAFDDATNGTTADNILSGSFSFGKNNVNDTPNRVVVEYTDEQIREHGALLDGDLAYDATTIPYKDGDEAISGGVVYINGEAITYAGDTGTSLTGCSARTQAYVDSYPLFWGQPLYSTQTAIFNDYDAQDAAGRVIEQTIDGRGIPTYDQAYQMAAYYCKKSVYGNLRCTLTGQLDSLHLIVGDVVQVTHDLPGWVAKQFRVVSVSENEGEEAAYELEYYSAYYYGVVLAHPPNPTGSYLPNPNAQPADVESPSLSVVQTVTPTGVDSYFLDIQFSSPSGASAIFWDHADVYYTDDNWLTRSLHGSFSSGLSLPLLKVTPDTTYKVVFQSVSTLGKYQTWADCATAELAVPAKPNPSMPAGFEVRIVANLIELAWEHIADADLWAYEIRVGASWAAGTVIVSGCTQNAFTWKPDQSGTLNFWLKAIDMIDNYSTDAAMCSLVIQAPPAVTSLTQQVIDNFVLLKWTGAAGTFPIKEYEVRKGDTYAGSTLLGSLAGTFYTWFETTAGTYRYWITARDTNDLLGAATSVTAAVNEPPDFKLHASWHDAFGGTPGGMYYDPADACWFACVEASPSTWDAWGTAHSITTMQDFIDLGGYVIEPMETSASYEEVYDAGAMVPSTMITVSLDKEQFKNTVTITPTISVSTTGTDWTDYAGVWQIFVSNFRYVKVTLDFTGTASDILKLFSLDVVLSVKLMSDTGKGTITSSSAGGVFKFNKVFSDIDSVHPAANSATAALPVYTIVDAVSVCITGGDTTSVILDTGQGGRFLVDDWIKVDFATGPEITQITGISGDDLTVSPALSGSPPIGTTVYPASVRIYLFNVSGTKITGDWSCSVDGY